jgi:uncharacterized protein YndB with AHSA1/START domain
MILKWLMGLVVLLALVAGGLWIAGQREGAGRHAGSITIAAPADEVFDWLVDADKRKAWQDGLESITPLNELGDTVVGGKSRLRVVLDGNATEFDLTVAEIDAPHRLIYDSHAEGEFAFDYVMAYELSEADGQTTVDLICDGEYHGALMGLMEPLISAMADDKLEQDMARLKQLVEAGG